VDASASDPVLRVIDPRRLEVVASVPLGDVMKVAVNAAAHVVSAPIGATDIELKVISRPAAVDTGTASVPIRLAVTAAGTIPVGIPLQIDIDAEQHQGVVLVPAAAIVREGDETAVFVAQDGKAQRRAVSVGLDDGMHVEIASGVKAGEAVIVDGQAGLPDDAAISVRGTAAPAATAPGTKQDDRP
jgi:RND family efflux transporter MFP subunit